MSGNIETLFASIPGLKQDFKIDWREDAKADWKNDWDAVPGGAAGAAPVNTVLGVISGTAMVGEVLSVTAGTWTGNPAPAITYQWLVDGSPVMDATGSTYTIQESDVDLMISVEITGTNSIDAVVATADAVGPVVAAI